MSDNLGFTRLPPDVLQPTPQTNATAGALAGAADQPTVQTRWLGKIVGTVSTPASGFVVHLFADPDSYNVTVGNELATTPSIGDTVIVGMLDDYSIAIIGVP